MVRVSGEVWLVLVAGSGGFLISEILRQFGFTEGWLGAFQAVSPLAVALIFWNTNLRARMTWACILVPFAIWYTVPWDLVFE